MKKIFILMILIGIGKSDTPAQNPDPVIQSILSDINPDSIGSVMQSLQDFGTRYALANNHRNVAVWIQNKYLSYGLSSVTLDSFYTSVTGWQYNVVATMTGTAHPDTVYIVGGHYDSYAGGTNYSNAPGADDNASGTAAAMEMARILQARGYQPRCTVKFMAFAAEELGLYGSHAWATQAHAQNMIIKMMINSDMISYCSSDNNWRITLQHYPNSQTVTSLATTVATTYTSLPVTLRNDDIAYSDSWSFYSEGYKTIFLQEYEFTPYYHTINDRLQYSNLGYAAEMTRVSCGMLLMENGILTGTRTHETSPRMVSLHSNYPNPFNPGTTIRFELDERSTVALIIYNTLGQPVRTLISGQSRDRGLYTPWWDGLTDHGEPAASGVYICRLEASGVSVSRKMTLMK